MGESFHSMQLRLRQAPKPPSPQRPPEHRFPFARNVRRLPLWLVLAGTCLTAALSGSDPQAARTAVRDIALDPGRLQVNDVSGWSRVDLFGGAHGSFASGSPDLPTYPVHVELPAGTRALRA